MAITAMMIVLKGMVHHIFGVIQKKLGLAGTTVHQKKEKTIKAIAVMLVATVIKILAHLIIGAT